MKTIEELEAELETVTRERDLSLSAWESAGMTGCTAQSAMLELTRQLEEARETIVALTTAKAEADLEIATLTAALDERDVEAERGLEQYDRLVRERDRLREQVVTVNNNIETFQKEMWRYKRERDEARAELASIHDDFVNTRNDDMTGDALALKIATLLQERDHAQKLAADWLDAYRGANDHAWAEHVKVDALIAERDEALAEGERLRRERDAATSELAHMHDEYTRIRSADAGQHEMTMTCVMLVKERDEARAEVERLTRESATLNAMLDGRMPDTWREDIETLTHQLADATNESTHFQVMCKRETEEVERLARQVELLTDERDELLVRVANQDAELRATRESYNEARTEVERLRAGKHTRDCRKQSAYNVACVCGADDAKRAEVTAAYRRGAEAMRDECIGAACEFFMGTTGFCNGDEDELEAVLEALPIPEEP
jgi:uncharacterized coiled-coil DUF342 family protein